MEQHHYTEQIYDEQTGKLIGAISITHIETTLTAPHLFRLGDADLTDFSNMTMEVRDESKYRS